MTQAWLFFAALAIVIAVAGYWLSRLGDLIGERTGVSGGWIGLGLIATVTSLPELASGVSAVTIERAPNLAVGHVVGACVFNLLLLSVVDLFYRKGRLYERASQGHALSAGYSCILLGVVGIGILAPNVWPGAIVGPATLLIVLIYGLALRTLFTYERRSLLQPVGSALTAKSRLSLPKAVAGFSAAAVVVVSAGLLLPGAAIGLANEMGWSNSFVGTLFLPVATSLPELMVTLFAVRLGALDMAVANLLGSNLFNIVVLAVDDLLFPEGPLLPAVSEVHAVSIFTALIMNGVVIAGLIYRPNGRPARAVSWVSLALVAAYVANSLLLYASSG